MHLLIIFFLSVLSVNAQEVHFFGSLDYARTTTKNDVTWSDIQNSFSAANLDTAGINVSAKFNENTQGLVQVIHAPIPNKINTDLIQIQRTFSDDIKVRIGQQRMPIFLKSEVIQVKALYPWLIPPPQVYNQNPIRSFIGASLEKSWENVSAQVYGGSIDDELYLGENRIDIEGDDLFGARLNYTNDSFDSFLHYSKSRSNVSFVSDVDIGGGVLGKAETLIRTKNVEVLSGGLSYEPKQWLFMSEYIHMVTSSGVYKTVEGAYASAGYRFTEKFLTLLTYSTDIRRTTYFTPSLSTSYDVAFQYSLDENTSLKLGFSHVNFRRKVKPTALSATGTSDSGGNITGDPGGNFDVYDLQLAFVF